MGFSLHTCRRLLLKLSGELLGAAGEICPQRVLTLCHQIRLLHQQYQVVLVVGGGNIIRGQRFEGSFLHSNGDSIGMLATVMNAMALLSGFRTLHLPAQIMCARTVEGVGTAYAVDAGLQALAQNTILICAGGIGISGVTTDTAAVVRGYELQCDAVLKGTKVAGVYGEDPALNPNAPFYPQLTYKQVLDQRLQIMDLTAVTLAWDKKLPLIIFSLKEPEGIAHLLDGTLPHSCIIP